MDILIIGDIHGCYFTLLDFLKNYWNKEKHQLLFLGDYVNKGNYSFEVLGLIMELKKKYGNQIILLKGNNEVLFEEKYLKKENTHKRKRFEKQGLDFEKTLNFLNKLPHFYEEELFFASHAGIAKTKNYPVSENDVDLLFNRKQLRNIGKVQFLGHIVVNKPNFNKKANAWYLDTGAGYGEKLTFAHLDSERNIIDIKSINVFAGDVD